MSVDSLTTAIRDVQRAADLEARDISNPNSTTMRTQQVEGKDGISRQVVTRYFDEGKLTELLKASEAKGSSEAINALAGEIHSIIGKDTDPHSLSGTFKKMIGALNITDATKSGVREQAITGVQTFFSKAQQVSRSLTELGDKAQGEISSAISDINHVLQSLYESNRRITGLSDERDNAPRSVAENTLAKLTESVGVKYTSSHGKVLALGSFGDMATKLVDEGSYVQLSYKDGDLTYAFYNDSGKMSVDNNLTIVDNAGKLKLNCGGKLEGLIKFQHQTLPDLRSNIDNAIGEVAKGINIVHNEGSGFPPPTSSTSARKVFAGDKVPEGLGIVNFAPIGEDGRAVPGILPVRVDTASATDVESLVNLINREGEAQSKAGVALGPNVNDDDGKYLISQVSLDASDITNGAGKLKLRLESGSDYDAKVRIKNAVIQDAALANAGIIDTNDAWMEVKAGEVQFSPSFNFTIPNAGNQDSMHIAFEIETIGKDGTFSTEVVRYTIDSGANGGLVNFATTNSYIQADNPAPLAGADWLGVSANPIEANVTQAKTNGPVVTADLIGDHLVIGGRALMVGGKFSEHFGLNDMLERDSDGNWNVREDISENPALLAIAKPTKQVSAKGESNLVGLEKASSSFRATGADIQANNTITINGITFTFAAAPANPQEVALGVDDQASLVNLYNLVKSGAFPSVSELVELSDPANNAITITAKHAGINGNSIEIASDINGGNNLWRSERKHEDTVVTTLDGGRSKGEDKATATFDLMPGNPVINDTITINGFELTFVAGAPLDETEVRIGGTPADTITNLHTQLTTANNYPALTAFLNFTINGGALLVEAQEAGTHANTVEINSLVNGGNVWVTTNPGFLDGGTDAQGVREAKRFGWDIASDNNYNALRFGEPVQFATGFSQTLQSTFMSPVLRLQAKLEDISGANQVNSEAYDQAMQIFSDSRKLDPNQAIIELAKRVSYMRTLLAAQQILHAAKDAAMNSITVR